MNIEIGSILENTFASLDNPLRYSLVIGINSKYVNVMYKHGRKYKNARYFKIDIGKGINPIEDRAECFGKMFEITKL